jgi:glucosamine kinase
MSTVSSKARAMRPVIVGIDAGGSSTRARAMAHGRVVHDGTGGPGNPVGSAEQTLEASYAAALAGCPAPDHVAACVSGAAGPEQRARITRLLAGLLPGAAVQVLPDYVAAAIAAPAGADLVVIAGTGSLVCSRTPDGSYQTSGGRGWIVGDRGSAASLGRALLEWFSDDPGSAGARIAVAVERQLGSADWRAIVRCLSTATSPAALLARAAPVLTCAAEHGASWASELLDQEMAALAGLAGRHIKRHLAGREVTRVALSGGVWNSAAAESSFTAAMKRAHPGLEVTRSRLSPLDGALRLAETMAG